jgi:hypothetical protein
MACQWKQRPRIGDWALERQRRPRLYMGRFKLRSTFVPFISQPQLLAMHTRSILPASPPFHNPRTEDFLQLARAESWLVPVQFAQPWLTVSLVLTDDKLRAWDKLGIGYAAHVSFRVSVSFRIHTASYLLPSRMWIADFSVIFGPSRTSSLLMSQPEQSSQLPRNNLPWTLVEELSAIFSAPS